MKRSFLIAAMAMLIAVTPAKVCAQETEVTDVTEAEPTEVQEESSSSMEEENEAPAEDEVVSEATPAEDETEPEPVMEDAPARECPSVVEIGEVDYDTDKGEVVSVSTSPSMQETAPTSEIKWEIETMEAIVIDDMVSVTEDEAVTPLVLPVKGAKRIGYDRPLTRSVQTGDKENAALLTLIMGLLAFSMIFLNTYNIVYTRAKEYFVRTIARSRSDRERFGFHRTFRLLRHIVPEPALQGIRIPYREKRIGYCRV
ncbi:MAG: hypothetical protein K2K56_04460 [Lachnospiraceae bacterium]|nr:hypothetical protein [Lachnospiraceae bacterium]